MSESFKSQPEIEEKSKTQLKNEAADLQKLGEYLVDLPQKQLERFELDEELLHAIELAGRINRKKDGFRRQLQFIGKLLRQRDTTEIERLALELQSQKQGDNKRFHELERVRDELLTNGDEKVMELVSEHPLLERQKLRQLIRQAQKEQEQNKPPASARQLFKYLREVIVDGL